MPGLSGSPALILDLDGTLHPGTIGFEVLSELVLSGNADQEAAHTALTAISGRSESSVPFCDTVETAYTQYLKSVDGISHRVLTYSARRAWRSCRRTVFEFVHPMLSTATKNGYETVLISGSPIEAVAEASLDLGISYHYGAQVAVVDGYCCGYLERAPGRTGEKRRCLDEFNDHLLLDLHRSVAIGNSASDVEIFSSVGYPIAFEADAELAPIARERGWPIADRKTVFRVLLSALEPEEDC